MELKEVIDFLKNSDSDTRAIVRAVLKRKPMRIPIKEVCQEDINTLLSLFPHTTDEFKGYRYNTTSITYLNYVRELANVLTHNFVCRQNTRGYPAWTGTEDVSQGREEEYKSVFHALTETIAVLFDQLGTQYNTQEPTQNP